MDQMDKILRRCFRTSAKSHGESLWHVKTSALKSSEAFLGFLVGFWKKNADYNCFKWLLLLGWDHCLSLLLRNQVETLQFLCQSEWYSSNKGTWPGRTKCHQTLIFSLFLTFGSSLTVTEEVGWLHCLWNAMKSKFTPSYSMKQV